MPWQRMAENVAPEMIKRYGNESFGFITCEYERSVGEVIEFICYERATWVRYRNLLPPEFTCDEHKSAFASDVAKTGGEIA